MTANVMQQDLENCTAAGMNGHVAKPIDPDDLFRTLLKWIKPKQAAPVAEEKPLGKPATVAAPTAAPPAQEGGLPAIDGLDAALGLKRAVGKKPLYLSMLRKYVSNQENTPADLRAALDAGDHATAERLAHTAKGVSGNIGATALQGMAAELEKMIKENAARDAIEARLAPFAEALTAMIAQIRAALPAEEKQTSTATPVDAAKAGEVVNKLAGLLANDDSEAGDVLEENLDLLRSTLGSDALDRIDYAVKQYDLEKALELLKDRAAALDIAIS
jgi:two-component system, sensor histidine kinase and response regulator